MTTSCLRAHPAALKRASELLRQGQLVAFPTETVYGLGANGLDPDAVRAIFVAKGRPMDNPLILHVAKADDAWRLGQVNEAAKTLADAFWPGPLTILLPRLPIVPDCVTAGLSTVALRCPDHAVARELIALCGLPLAAPSANLSGRPSPTTAAHVLHDFEGLIPMIIDGGECRVGLESTVLDLSRDVPTVLRPGAVTAEQLATVLGEVALAPFLMQPPEAGVRPLSPGMSHRHYAPQAPMTLLAGDERAVARHIKQLYDNSDDAAILAMDQHADWYGERRVYSLGKDAADAAHRLFYLLRQLDEQDVKQIFAETLPATGLGLAVMNRLARAADFHTINVNTEEDL